nr:uncharacterized protein LOC129465414 [Symphalangus syndactylus]
MAERCAEPGEVLDFAFPVHMVQGGKVCRARTGSYFAFPVPTAERCAEPGEVLDFAFLVHMVQGGKVCRAQRARRLSISGANGAGRKGVQSPQRSWALHFQCTWCGAGRCVETGECADFAFPAPTAGPEGVQSPERSPAFPVHMVQGGKVCRAWRGSDFAFPVLTAQGRKVCRAQRGLLHFRCTWCRAGRCAEPGEGSDFSFPVPTVQGRKVCRARSGLLHFRCTWCRAGRCAEPGEGSDFAFPVLPGAATGLVLGFFKHSVLAGRHGSRL